MRAIRYFLLLIALMPLSLFGGEYIPWALGDDPGEIHPSTWCESHQLMEEGHQGIPQMKQDCRSLGVQFGCEMVSAVRNNRIYHTAQCVSR
jgi:hypothetical protein